MHWITGCRVLVSIAAVTLAQVGTTQAVRSADAPSAGIASADWESIRAAYEAGRYALAPITGGFRARNAGQRWATEFDGRGFTTRPEDGEWTWGLELMHYGFAGQERGVERPIEVTAAGQRIVYRWDSTLEEWYVNDSRGLEHGYTLQHRPLDSSIHAVALDRELELSLAVRGTLVPRVASDGRSVVFESSSGNAVVTYAGLHVFDADGSTLPSRFERRGDRIVLLTDERNARYPITIDPLAQQAYLKASNTEAQDNFGVSVAVSGDTVVVGAIGEDSSATGVDGNQADNGALSSGAAYVFVRNGTGWSQQAYLKASNTESGDVFGRSVSISGDTIVVGADQEDSSATGVNGNGLDNGALYSGAAYVFVRSGSVWSQQAYLKASNTNFNDWFGYSVAVSGDSVLVGAHFEASQATGVNGDDSDNSAPRSGAAYVFVRTETTWTQQAYLKASNSESGDHFGFTVALAGGTVVIGADRESSAAVGVNGNGADNSAGASGAAYAFARTDSVWAQQAYLKASNTGGGDAFGWSVSVSGDTIVVGAQAEDSGAIGVNGDESDNGTFGAGASYVFVRGGTTWSQEAYLKACNPTLEYRFGNKVTVSGDWIAIGSLHESSGAVGVNGNKASVTTRSGAAYLFERIGSSWSQTAHVKAFNTGAFDLFGQSVALSGDTLVVGAHLESSDSTGVNGPPYNNRATSAGAAFVFRNLTASATLRNAGSNPASYTATAPVLGGAWTGTVDLTTTGHSFAQIVGYSDPANIVLPKGQVALVGGAKLAVLPPRPGPLAMWTDNVPNDPAIAGTTLYTQAVHYGPSGFKLSNAQDLFVWY